MEELKQRKGKGGLRAAVLVLLLCASVTFWATGCGEEEGLSKFAEMLPDSGAGAAASESESLEEVPEYEGEPYVVLSENVPEFEEEEIEEVTASDGEVYAYESYDSLDRLGRCGTAEAVVGEELMPTEDRGSIGQVKPSGWHTVRYDNVEGKYLYNRCHLIGYQLTGENANEQNLITGTRYMNTEGMLPFEDMVADYVKETGNHVIYRVIPIYKKDNLVADGVQMEALSIEDGGEGICFNVYVYNVQPGIEIDYATGESRAASRGEQKADGEKNGAEDGEVHDYILNTSSKKFHKLSCSGVSDIKEKNMDTFRGSRKEITAQGYEPCGRCRP